ncbi:MAG: PAS domain S-box protein [Candidatus Hydrogenedentota bacterium]
MADPVNSAAALEEASPEVRSRLAAYEQALVAAQKEGKRAVMLAQAADCASEGLCLLSETTIIEYANKPFADMHGSNNESVCNRPLEEFLLPQSGKWNEYISRARTDGAVSIETQHSKADGSSFSGFARLFFAKGGPKVPPYLMLRIREAPQGSMFSQVRDSQSAASHILVDAAPDCITFFDLSGRIRVINAIGAEKLGYASVDELCRARETVVDLIAPHDRERALREISACIAQGNKFSVEYDCLTKDGQVLPVEVNTSVVLDHQNHPVGFVGISRDITRRREAERRLQQHLSMEKLLTATATRFINLQPDQIDEAIDEAIRQIGETIGVDHIGIGLLSRDGKHLLDRFDWGITGPAPSITDRLEQSLECFPWIMGQLRNRECIRFSHFADLPPDAQEERDFFGLGPPRSLLMAPMMDRGYPAGYVGFEVMREGYEWDEALCALILLLAEVFAGAISRKRAEEALRESEERFRQLVGSSHAMFWLATADFGHALYVSPAFAEVCKVSIEKLYADPLAFLAAVHPDDRERLAKSLADEFHEGDIEFRIVQPDGATRWLVHKGFPIRNRAGKAYRFAGFAEDVTERKLLEKELLEISSREQRRIGRDLHDGLGQHLTGILFLSRGLAQTLAEKNAPEAAEVAEIADLIKQAINHTRTLARGACPVDLEAGGLANALRKLGEHTERMTGIECLFESDDSVLVSSPAQAEHLYRIAQEAVSNAVKHAEATQIRIMLIETGVGKLLQIEDNGKGLPLPMHEGSGMGLRLMEHRARMADASFVVKRRFGGGTEVSCLFRTGTMKKTQDEGNHNDND